MRPHQGSVEKGTLTLTRLERAARGLRLLPAPAWDVPGFGEV